MAPVADVVGALRIVIGRGSRLADLGVASRPPVSS